MIGGVVPLRRPAELKLGALLYFRPRSPDRFGFDLRHLDPEYINGVFSHMLMGHDLEDLVCYLAFPSGEGLGQQGRKD